MRNGLYTKRLLLLCAVAGCITGFGIDALAQKEDATKDNTLVRKEYDSVFFSEEISATPTPHLTKRPTVSATPVPQEVSAPVPTKGLQAELTPVPQDAVPGMTTTVVPPLPTIGPTAAGTVAPTATPTANPTRVPEKTATPIPTETVQITLAPTPVSTTFPQQKPEEVSGGQDSDKQEVITYPAEIFGQVPQINRTDETVTYFEFAMDLIALLEEEIRQKNLNEISLFTKFMVKALFCGINIEELKINEPIPRRQAALAIHLAAEVMGKRGTVKSTKNVTLYATDMGDCSAAEKKAVIYLYECGVTQQEDGQRFSPDAALKERNCSEWMKHLKTEWR